MKEHKKRLKKLEALAKPGEDPTRIEVWKQAADGLFRSDDHPGQALTRGQVSERAEGRRGHAVKIIAVYRPQLGPSPEHALVGLPDNGR